MANRWLDQFFYSFVKQPVFLTGSYHVGAAGAITQVVGGGIASVTRLAAGVHRIVPQDQYNLFFCGVPNIISPSTGGAVAGGAFVPATLYTILTLGNTTVAQWVAAGLPLGVVPTIGLPFVATTVGAGTGTVQAVTPSGISITELAGSPNVHGSLATPAQGLVLGFYGPTDATHTPPILTDPASGSVVKYGYFLRNSSVKTGGQ